MSGAVLRRGRSVRPSRLGGVSPGLVRRAVATILLPLTLAWLCAACTAASPGWTYDPGIGLATGPAASGAASAGPASPAPPSGQPSPAPSAPAIPGASASPAGQVIQLTAKNIAFDTNSLSVSAGQPFTVAFDNEDSQVPHNVAIYTDNTATNVLFRGDVVTGPATTSYAVPALQPGTYFFRCDIHPTLMFGTLVVK